jgi:hypothetical protein
MTPEQILEARAWIADCQWGDLDDTDELSDGAVIQGIRRSYEGGIAQFIADGE